MVYIDVIIDGHVYQVPVGNPQRAQDIYFLKRAVEDDDRVARAMFLGGEKSRAFYAGDDESKLWIYVTEDDEWVGSPK